MRPYSRLGAAVINMIAILDLSCYIIRHRFCTLGLRSAAGTYSRIAPPFPTGIIGSAFESEHNAREYRHIFGCRLRRIGLFDGAKRSLRTTAGEKQASIYSFFDGKSSDLRRFALMRVVFIGNIGKERLLASHIPPLGSHDSVAWRNA